MKPYLSVVLLLPVLMASCVLAAHAEYAPDAYQQVEVCEPADFADYTTNTEDDSYAFILESDIVVPSDIYMNGGKLIFTTQGERFPVSLVFCGGDSSALSNQYSLMFDILSCLSFSNYCEGAILASGNLIIQNVNDGADNPEEPDVIFSDNARNDSYGGAICAEEDVTIRRNGGIIFSGNYASTQYNWGGGAIGAEGDVTINDNEWVTFSDNYITSSGNGGAIFAAGVVSINGNGNVSLLRNSLGISSFGGYGGGAIYSRTAVNISGNADLIFSENDAKGSGAVIYAPDVSISGNKEVSFTGNYVHSGWHGGGAIAGASVSLSGNELVDFIGNSSLIGGAIYSIEGSMGDITISENGDVRFLRNSSSDDYYYSRGSFGGAIYARGAVVICGNENVVFSENSSRANGGAIYVSGNLLIQNNASVLFEKNAEVENGTYRLRSIYAAGGEEISLSVAAGKSVEFRDSVYIASGSTVNLNADYEDVWQRGDIIFTGAYTEQHLNELLETSDTVRMATADEIQVSCTSEVNTMTNLYGGRLLVEDGAVYKGYGVTAHLDSGSTVLVKNAELSHVGYALEFNAGTALEVAGCSTIRGSVNLLADSLFKLEQAATLSLHDTLQADAAELTVQGTALLAGNSTLNASLALEEGSTLDMMSLDAGAVTLNGALIFGAQVTLGENLGHEGSITLFTGLENVDWATVTGNAVSDCVWAGAVFSNMAGNHSYYLNYASDTGSLVMQIVPEPATASLSLLALAGLAARRRRK